MRRALLLTAVVAAVAALPVGAASAACADETLVPSDASTAARAEVATLCLVNAERAKQGLAALRDDRLLDQSAQGHSDDMVARQYFAHEAPAPSPHGADPEARIKATGYLDGASGYSVGENIAWGGGGGDSFTPAEIVDAWMHSEGHRRNILTPSFTDSGIGIAIGAPKPGFASPAATYTHNFGATDPRRPDDPSPALPPAGGDTPTSPTDPTDPADPPSQSRPPGRVEDRDRTTPVRISVGLRVLARLRGGRQRVRVTWRGVPKGGTLTFRCVGRTPRQRATLATGRATRARPGGSATAVAPRWCTGVVASWRGPRGAGAGPVRLPLPG